MQEIFKGMKDCTSLSEVELRTTHTTRIDFKGEGENETTLGKYLKCNKSIINLNLSTALLSG